MNHPRNLQNKVLISSLSCIHKNTGSINQLYDIQLEQTKAFIL